MELSPDGPLRNRVFDDLTGLPVRGGTASMHEYHEEPRLQCILGEGAWNLNRWKARGDVPGITKEQPEAISAKY